MLRTYQDLKVWQKAFRLCARVYTASRGLPRDERFGLTSQMRRAAVSVPCNIVEGYARGSTRDYVRFLRVASGSLAELETQLLLVKELKLEGGGDLSPLMEDVDEVERMLSPLIRSLIAKENPR